MRTTTMTKQQKRKAVWLCTKQQAKIDARNYINLIAYANKLYKGKYNGGL
jgi:hypothetical protein